MVLSKERKYLVNSRIGKYELTTQKDNCDCFFMDDSSEYEYFEQGSHIVEMPTQEQVVAGNLVASELITASCRKNMKGLGGCKEFNIADYSFPHIIKAYIENNIDSTTGIWLAMRERENDEQHIELPFLTSVKRGNQISYKLAASGSPSISEQGFVVADSNGPLAFCRFWKEGSNELRTKDNSEGVELKYLILFESRPQELVEEMLKQIEGVTNH